MSKPEYAYQYEFTFVQDEAGRPFVCLAYATSFMKAYQQAVGKLKKAKKSKAPTYKLEHMDRRYSVPF